MPALGPEPLADAILMRWAKEQDKGDRIDKGHWIGLCEMAMEANPNAVEARLHCLWTGSEFGADYPPACDWLQRTFDARYPERVASVVPRAKSLVNQVAMPKEKDTAARFADIDKALAALDEILRGRPHDQQLQIFMREAAGSAISAYGKAQNFAADIP